MIGSDARWPRPLPAVLALAGLLLAPAVTASAAGPRLLVMDLPYGRVWDSAVRAFDGRALVRASGGVIETARIERAPLPDEEGVDRVAERITVQVEAMADNVTRVTVTVEAEAFRNGRWEPLGGSPTTIRAVLDRIRAGIG